MALEHSRLLRERLPFAVYDLAHRLGALHGGAPYPIRLHQEGRMRETGAAAWMRFRATQTLWTDRCAFDWRARVGPGGCIHVRDTLLDDGGRLEVSMLGVLPLARARFNPALTQGDLLRYLAELAWAPEAIVHNEALHWTVLGADTMRVAACSAGMQAEITFTLDGQGFVAEAFAEQRPRAVKDGFVYTPWRGRFADYRLEGGLWTPSLGRVCWIVNGRPEMVWEGRHVRREPAPATTWSPSSRRWGVPAEGFGHRA